MSPGRVLYVVVCAAPAASGVEDLVRLAQGAGWRVCVIATPLGLRFIDADRLASLTGEPVRSEWRMPGEVQGLPSADAVIVAPATFCRTCYAEPVRRPVARWVKVDRPADRSRRLLRRRRHRFELSGGRRSR